MAVRPTSIEGLLVIDWPTHHDDRGFFRQTVQTAELEAALGRPVTFAQANHARSVPGVLRGFHAEPWDKCVYVARGMVFAAVADVRPDSPTFGRVETFHLGDRHDDDRHDDDRLGDGGRIRLFVAEGLANAYCAYGTGPVDYLYDVSAPWREIDKRAIAWDDPDLAVVWPISDPIVSDDDRRAPRLRERFPDHPDFVNRHPAAGQVTSPPQGERR